MSHANVDFGVELVELPIVTVDLQLSVAEAMTLLTILRRIGGDPDNSPRKYVSELVQELERVGIPPLKAVEFQIGGIFQSEITDVEFQIGGIFQSEITGKVRSSLEELDFQATLVAEKLEQQRAEESHTAITPGIDW